MRSTRAHNFAQSLGAALRLTTDRGGGITRLMGVCGLLLAMAASAQAAEGYVPECPVEFRAGEPLLAEMLSTLKRCWQTETERLAMEDVLRAKAGTALAMCYTKALSKGTTNASVDVVNMLPGESGDTACERGLGVCEDIIGLYMTTPGVGSVYEATIWPCSTSTPVSNGLGVGAVFACCNR